MFFLSHRLPIAQAARSRGYQVEIATMGTRGVETIEQLGFRHHRLPLSRSGRNPLKELITLYSLWRLLRETKPGLVHLVTIKPVLYGGIAARILKIPGVVSAISGLGFLFVRRSAFVERVSLYLALLLYRLSLRHPNQRVIFQNPDDMKRLGEAVGLDEGKIRLIPGSGVDLQAFPETPEPDGLPVVVMASRLLTDKGIYQFVEAARILSSSGVKARFQLIGEPDPGNPQSVSQKTIREWTREGVVECLGFREDIPQIFSRAHIVTLPSFYGEGLPKVLVEAAACGRAVVTTDWPGCRDAIEPGDSGLLVTPRDSQALADALQRLVEDPDLRRRMGKAGRKLAEERFAIEKVVDAHLAIYRELEPRC